MFKIKSHTEYHSSDGYDIDEIVERVTNKFLEEKFVPISYLISVNTTPTYKTDNRGVYIQGIYITIIYKDYIG